MVTLAPTFWIFFILAGNEGNQSLKDLNFHYYLLSLQLDVVPCGGRKKSPRTHL